MLPVYLKESADARAAFLAAGSFKVGDLLFHLLLEGADLVFQLLDAVPVLFLAQLLELGDGGLRCGDFRPVLLADDGDAPVGFRQQCLGDVRLGAFHHVQFLLRLQCDRLLFLLEQLFKQLHFLFAEACPLCGVVGLGLLALVIGDVLVYLGDGGTPLLLNLKQFRCVGVGEALVKFLLEGLELLAESLVLLRHLLRLFGAGGTVNLFNGVGHVLPHLVSECLCRFALA